MKVVSYEGLFNAIEPDIFHRIIHLTPDCDGAAVASDRCTATIAFDKCCCRPAACYIVTDPDIHLCRATICLTPHGDCIAAAIGGDLHPIGDFTDIF